MEPNIKAGQKLISWNWGGKVSKGDLVAIQFGGRKLVKRVEKINRDQFYVLGDNKKMSTDSRKFGWIGKSQVIGKIVRIFR
jgi:type IV secretory pathway protease TraF